MIKFKISKRGKILLGVWCVLTLLLFPFGPFQFTNLGWDFYRAWSFELLPALLLLMVVCLDLVSDRDVKFDVLIVLIPATVLSTLLALWNLGAQIAAVDVDKKESIFCKPKQNIKTNSGTVVSCESFDWVHSYFEVRQEWALGPGLKFVRYIDRVMDPPPMHISVNNRTVESHYDGNRPPMHTVAQLW